METQGKAATTHSAEDCARQAEIAAKAQAYGFSHDDVLRALDAVAMPKFAVGGRYPGDFLVSTDVAAAHSATLQSAACNPSPDAVMLLAELTAEIRALRAEINGCREVGVMPLRRDMLAHVHASEAITPLKCQRIS
ncbi:hypothetical protein [Delftia acidovorans]|uniref:hypothetical protein n=1 Tax=Delftia acidovorans TaxID=80866 RepID=UPI000F843C55|nr:hypothetical protein [Delftia acidovorans]